MFLKTLSTPTFVEISRLRGLAECVCPPGQLPTLPLLRFGSVMMCDSFHADVHAGNLLVLKDGRVAFIDFGIVGRISPQTWNAMQVSETCGSLAAPTFHFSGRRATRKRLWRAQPLQRHVRGCGGAEPLTCCWGLLWLPWLRTRVAWGWEGTHWPLRRRAASWAWLPGNAVGSMGRIEPGNEDCG